MSEKEQQNLCDKCGKEVPHSNDLSYIMAIKDNIPSTIFAKPSRHFLPVPGCEGSPSRAQYIEGQKRSLRYPYKLELEQEWREAHAEAIRRYGQNSD